MLTTKDEFMDVCMRVCVHRYPHNNKNANFSTKVVKREKSYKKKNNNFEQVSLENSGP